MASRLIFGPAGFRVPPCLLGALPPNPRHLPLWANGMKNAPGLPLGANDRGRYARTAAVENRTLLASSPSAAAVVVVGWGLPHHPLFGGASPTLPLLTQSTYVLGRTNHEEDFSSLR